MAVNNFYTSMAGQWESEVTAQGEGRVTLPAGVLKVFISDEGTQIGKAAGATEQTHLVQRIEFTVAEGEFKGATHTVWLSIINPNEVATRIAKSTLKSLFLAIGQYPKASLGELKNKVFKIKTEHKLGTYVDRDATSKPSLNVEVKGYFAVDTVVVGEDTVITASDTWNSPAGLAFTASLAGNTVQAAFASPVQAVRPPSAPPTQPPKAPVAPTQSGSEESAPAWLS
jgi:hypothetical protein